MYEREFIDKLSECIGKHVSNPFIVIPLMATLANLAERRTYRVLCLYRWLHRCSYECVGGWPISLSVVEERCPLLLDSGLLGLGVRVMQMQMDNMSALLECTRFLHNMSNDGMTISISYTHKYIGCFHLLTFPVYRCNRLKLQQDRSI